MKFSLVAEKSSHLSLQQSIVRTGMNFFFREKEHRIRENVVMITCIIQANEKNLDSSE